MTKAGDQLMDMAGNPSYNQFGMNQMNFQENVPTGGYGHHLKSLASMTAGVNRIPPNINSNATIASGPIPHQRNYGNHFPNQQNSQVMSTEEHSYFLSALSESCREKFRRSHDFTNRIQLQQFLLNKCTDPSMMEYLKNSFVADLTSELSFQVIQSITKFDTSKLKTRIGLYLQMIANPQLIQKNLPGNQSSPDNFTPQNSDVQGSYNQFQVPGSNNSRNSNARTTYNQPHRVNSTYPTLPPQQQQQQRSFQRGNVPNLTENMQYLTQNTRHPQQQQTNQSTSGQRWYSMPKETYEAGRVVQEKNNSLPSPQGTVPLTHYNEPGPRTSSSHSQFYQAGMSSHGSERLSPAHSQISPRTEAQCNNVRMNNDSPNHPQFQPRPRSAETTPSANMCHSVSSLQQERFVESDLQNCCNNGEKQPPVDSKETMRKVKKLLEEAGKNMPETEKSHLASKENMSKVKKLLVEAGKNMPETEKSPKTAYKVQQEIPQERVSGTPTLPVEESHGINNTEPTEDITNIFSMPVLCDELGDPKEDANSLLAKNDKTKHLDDMNVLSPYTAVVVSDSVNTWLSGSMQSAVLDRVGSKTSQGRQMTKPEKPSPPTGSAVERTRCEEDINTLHGTVLPPQTEPQDMAEYDPPLPVIKHRKREDRISPNKRSVSESKSQNSKDSTSVKESHVSENRKSLFSVMSDLITENNSSGNTISEIKSSESSDSQVDQHSNAHQKSRHKSSEVSSSSSPRHDKTFLLSSEKHHDDENNKPDSGKSVEQSKTGVEQSCKDKIVSDWKRNHIEKERNSLKGHHRRKSCNDQEIPRQRLNRERRSYTWEGASLAEKSHTGFTEIENTTDKPVPLHGKLVDFNGHEVLQIKIPDGTYLLMQELIATCFQDYDSKFVFKAKTSALGVNNITLTHPCRKDVIKYLDFLKIHYPSQLSVVSLSNAQRLFDHLTELKHTEKQSAEEKDPCVHQKEQSVVPPSDIKNRSASPDSTENACKKPVSEEESMETSVEGEELDDLQQNKVSSQSLDDLEDPNVSELSHISALEDNDDAASNVSDATDIYCEGKPLQPVSGDCSGDGSGEGSSEFKLPLGLEGGLAVVKRDNCPNTYLRYVIVRKNKCYVYKDLFSLFGKAQVVSVVINNYMKVKTCTSEEAEFFNRNQPSMSSVDPVDDSLLHDQYVRKIFLYFGEIFPKQKAPIDAAITHESHSLKRSREDRESEPPSKKRRHPNGSMDSSDKNNDSDNKMDDETMKMFNLLKGQHLEMAAEMALLKTQLKQAQDSNISLEKKYKLYSDNLITVKADFEDLQKKNALLEEGYKAQEESLTKMKEEIKAKDETIAELTTARDYFKNFVESITDTYQDGD